MFGIRAQTLGMSKITPVISKHQDRLDLNLMREDASSNIQKAAACDAVRFNRGCAVIKPYSKGDFVFIKSSERSQTKIDGKFRGPFVITAVLDHDRYELPSHLQICTRELAFSTTGT